MPKTSSSTWTADEREFDKIMSLLESPKQMDRIRGRMLLPKFEARFTPEQLAVMADHIGARKVKADAR